VVTGNWGQDLTLLIKAAKDAGLNAGFYTYYAGVTGTPSVMGSAGEGKVRAVSYIDINKPGLVTKLTTDFKAKFNDDWYTGATYNGIAMLVAAMAQSKSTDPVKVAQAMSGLKFQGFNGEVEMRKTDHQLQQAMYISTWRKVDAKNKYSVENTGFTFVVDREYPAYVASTPTSCQMKSP